MADLLLDPSTLKTLADRQTDAAKDAEAAANALNGTGGNCWLTHGVISGFAGHRDGGPTEKEPGANDETEAGGARPKSTAVLHFSCHLHRLPKRYELQNAETVFVGS